MKSFLADILPSIRSFLKEPAKSEKVTDKTVVVGKNRDGESQLEAGGGSSLEERERESPAEGGHNEDEESEAENAARHPTLHSIESILSPQDAPRATLCTDATLKQEVDASESARNRCDVLTLSALSSSAAETMFESRSMLVENRTEDPRFVEGISDGLTAGIEEEETEAVDESDCKPHLPIYDARQPRDHSAYSYSAYHHHNYDEQGLQAPIPNTSYAWPHNARYSPVAHVEAPQYAAQYHGPVVQPPPLSTIAPPVLSADESHFDDAACARYLYDVASSMSTALHGRGHVCPNDTAAVQPSATLSYHAVRPPPPAQGWRETQARAEVWPSNQRSNSDSGFPMSKPVVAQYPSHPVTVAPKQEVVWSFDRQPQRSRVSSESTQHHTAARYQAAPVLTSPLQLPVSVKQSAPVALAQPQHVKHQTRSRTQSFEIRQTRLLDPLAVYHMTQWLTSHMNHPYPTQEEKKHLAELGSITVAQVSSWFANKRSRLGTSFGKRAKLTNVTPSPSDHNSPTALQASHSALYVKPAVSALDSDGKRSGGTPPFLTQMGSLGSGKENSASGSDSDHSAHLRFKDARLKRGLREISPNVDVGYHRRTPSVASNLFSGPDSFIKRQKLS